MNFCRAFPIPQCMRRATPRPPRAPLTPVAVFEGKVAASTMLKGNHLKPEYRGVPSAVFTIPELTRIGLTEAEAKDQGLDVRVRFTETSDWYSNLRVGETHAATKVLIDNKTDEIIGAHLLGPEYAEITNFFSLAMRLGLNSGDLKKWSRLTRPWVRTSGRCSSSAGSKPLGLAWTDT